MKYQYLKVFQITGLLLIDALTDCNVLMCSILLLYIPFHIAVILQQYPMKSSTHVGESFLSRCLY